ncbi:hypothetical protein DL770_011321 [Monosporascus sp. CRB-9-2]|nr:hypothetical protein DL770_011321 [Monosporascus sp. CRB-9-2]|eukprot:GHVL01004689.1.p3 GENE.GHVL01004689.1~~GHVL01004689.1.p3  ORF type:complete len:108 (+),score=1.09 GHVL01004689.1:136-459(+)
MPALILQIVLGQPADLAEAELLIQLDRAFIVSQHFQRDLAQVQRLASVREQRLAGGSPVSLSLFGRCQADAQRSVPVDQVDLRQLEVAQNAVAGLLGNDEEHRVALR